MYALLLCNSLYEEFHHQETSFEDMFVPTLEEILAGHNMPGIWWRGLVRQTPAYFKYFWVLSSPSHQDKGTHFSI